MAIAGIFDSYFSFFPCAYLLVNFVIIIVAGLVVFGFRLPLNTMVTSACTVGQTSHKPSETISKRYTIEQRAESYTTTTDSEREHNR